MHLDFPEGWPPPWFWFACLAVVCVVLWMLALSRHGGW